MESKTYKKWSFAAVSLMALILAMLAACSDNDSGGGQPVINRVYQLDTVDRHKDSSFVAAEPYVLLVINGSNIGGVIRAYFNGFETPFNTNYNTNTDLIIRVPPEAPTDSTADNLIRLVTSHGEATYNFKIIAKPTISSLDKRAYGSDRGNITIKGKNFADMESVTAFRAKDFPTEKVTDSVVCEIISKSPDKIVVHIPDNTLSRVTLNFTNSSGTTYGADVLVNADLALKIFTEDFGTISSPDGDGKWNGDTWGNPVTVTSDQAFAGEKSMSVLLSSGGWSWFGVTSWWPRFYYDTDYKYVTFAIKGGDVDMPLWITSDATKAGFAEFPDVNKLEIRAGVWNHFIIPIEALDFMYSGSISPRIGFRPKGPDKSAVVYVDDFMFVK